MFIVCTRVSVLAVLAQLPFSIREHVFADFKQYLNRLRPDGLVSYPKLGDEPQATSSPITLARRPQPVR